MVKKGKMGRRNARPPLSRQRLPHKGVAKARTEKTARPKKVLKSTKTAAVVLALQPEAAENGLTYGALVERAQEKIWRSNVCCSDRRPQERGF